VAFQPRLEATLGFFGAALEVFEPRVSICHVVAASRWAGLRDAGAVTIFLDRRAGEADWLVASFPCGFRGNHVPFKSSPS
jgi:hypothetical protein